MSLSTRMCAVCRAWKSSVQNHSKFDVKNTNIPRLSRTSVQRKQPVRYYSEENKISSTGLHAVQKPSPFQQKVLVWAKMYPSVDQVPERVTRGQMKKAMDIFRVRTSICMCGLVLVFAAIMAMIGRKQRHQGMGLTKIVLDRRESDLSESKKK